MAPNNPPRRFSGLPLYLRIWLAVVGAVLVITLAFAWLWRANADEAPSGLRGREREIILRDANGEVLGRTRSRPVFVPGHGVEFAVPMEDGRTVIVHIPPRERPDEERGPESRGAPAGDNRPVPGSLSGMHRGGPPMLGPAPPSRPWLRGTNGLLIMLAVVALAVAVGSYPIIRRLTQRLEALRAGVERWGEGDLKARVDESGHDEAAFLARRFNRAAARVEQLVNSHKSLLANASHELRSPLTRIRMGLALLGPQTDDRVRAELERNIEELDQLVGEILLASRLDMPGAEIGTPEAVDLMGLAAEECARTGARLEVRPTRAPLVLQGQPRLLRRVLRNLLENAHRHGAGEVEMALAREDGAGGASAQAVLRVCDRGPGVPEAQRERIFEPFYRLPGASEHAGGVGLGLALVKSIVERHGGTVRCEGREGGGACFEVRLPLAGAAAGT
ncbi:MAG: HAMP domain-containing sensor histidine kinase [Ramlibacter sp.]|uniref:sensor histidine kinase n=1 Tax=Ramlibacter sp. TaxID=1917967 RepID=UPI0026392020|nr:HAMP domain-containing sensor histidine kinase [Ramlibacter sp.]MDH4375013.1 HAMP domain-containing sensor histidine kinase [Ramlibacter sp.]